MRYIGKSRRLVAGVLAGVAMLSLSCSNNELTESAAPVAIILSNEQTLDRIDLLPGAAGCANNIAEVTIRSILKDADPNVDQKFNDVRLRQYRISYRRTDGGTLIPTPFVQTIDMYIGVGTSGGLGGFRAFQPEAINQAPFAALLPQNGGRDPETGRTTVSMDVTLEVFGETLAGSNVSGSTSVPLTFCYNCGGCS